jgi:hypothetical protein
MTDARKMPANESERKSQAQDITTSNSLADLAARIRSKHGESALAIRCGLDHAIACGRLLLEARARLEHGQWLPWLREHCGVPERSARRYMELAAYASESISANLADLALDGAAEAAPELASIGQALEAGDWEIAGALAVRCFYDSPFSAQDFERDDRAQRISRKLRHQLKVPIFADWCFDVAEYTADGRPALRLCPGDELFETAKALVPIASSRKTKITELTKVSVKFDATSFDSTGEMLAATAEVAQRALWMLGNILNEIEDRDKISDERYKMEWNETHHHGMARLEQKIADLERERISRTEHAEVVS